MTNPYRFNDSLAMEITLRRAEAAPAYFLRRCADRIALKTSEDVIAFWFLCGLAASFTTEDYGTTLVDTFMRQGMGHERNP